MQHIIVLITSLLSLSISLSLSPSLSFFLSLSLSLSHPLQESITDIFVHYLPSNEVGIGCVEVLDHSIRIAKQVFRTLTEYVQGPCVGNQRAIALSRLWDAVSE